jgi:hypothetical protein
MRAFLLLSTLLLACPAGNLTLEELDPAAIPAEPTYTEHVQPILDYYCSACHDQNGQVGDIEGIDTTNYDDVVDEFDDIEDSIQDRFMPPANARQLTPREIAILGRWKDSNFPE